MTDKVEMLDEVQTELGKGLVVGFPEPDRVEVRFNTRGGQLHVFFISEVKKIEKGPEPITVSSPEPGMTYQEAREKGMTPPVDLAQFGDLGGAAPARDPDAKPTSTLARMVSDKDPALEGMPTSKSGKPLHGAAAAKARARQARGED